MRISDWVQTCALRSAVMLALHLGETVAERFEEILVGIEDDAVEAEADHGLGLVDGGELALEIGGLLFLRGDVGGELHHLDRAAAAVEHRIVAGLDPDFASALADPAILPGVVFAAPQLVPEGPVFGGLRIGRRDKHAVMLDRKSTRLN